METKDVHLPKRVRIRGCAHCKNNTSSEMTSEEFPKGKRRLSQIRKHDSKKCEKGTNMFFLNVRNHVLVLQKKKSCLEKDLKTISTSTETWALLGALYMPMSLPNQVHA